MSGARRADAGDAVAGMFVRNTATGGLAGRRPDTAAPAAARRQDAGERLRQGVELSEDEIGYLRALSRPGRTGQPRTLGSKFVATGVLAAAIDLLRESDVDMYGVTAGDLEAMTARARDALLRAAGKHTTEGSGNEC
jgi:hypothetical protein